jgi:hypothetical protein
MPASQTPAYDVDFWSDELILNPYPHYDAMRALGPAVWLSRGEPPKASAQYPAWA